MFWKFTLMNPLTYTGTLNEDAYECIVSFHERLHNLGLVESHGVDYTAFQMTGSAKSGGGIILVVVQLDLIHYPGLSLLRYFYPNLFHAVRGSARGPSLRVCSKMVCQLQSMRVNFMPWLGMLR